MRISYWTIQEMALANHEDALAAKEEWIRLGPQQVNDISRITATWCARTDTITVSMMYLRPISLRNLLAVRNAQ